MQTARSVLVLILGTAVTMTGLAAGGDTLPAPEQLDAMALEMTKASFHDKGIIKAADVFATLSDPTLRACSAADVAGKPLAPEEARRLEALNMQTIRWPEDGKYLGDWREGEKIAQSGRGRTWTDKPGAPNGGNCYNCHQIRKEEISFGTIGPSLFNFGKLRGVADPGDPKSVEVLKYTWGKIWNAKAYNACSNMPRMGAHDLLTEAQIRDLMALLLDPKSPVNE